MSPLSLQALLFALYMNILFNFAENPTGGAIYYYGPHFTDEETEA